MADPTYDNLTSQLPDSRTAPDYGTIGPAPQGWMGNVGSALTSAGQFATDKIPGFLLSHPELAATNPGILAGGIGAYMGGERAQATGQALTDWSQGFAPMSFSPGSEAGPRIDPKIQNPEQLINIAQGVVPLAGAAGRFLPGAAKAMRAGRGAAPAASEMGPAAPPTVQPPEYYIQQQENLTRQHAEHLLACDECATRADELIKQGMTPPQAIRAAHDEHYAGGESNTPTAASDDRLMGTPWPGTDTGVKLSDIEEPGSPGTTMAPRKKEPYDITFGRQRKSRGDSPRDYWVREGMNYERKARDLLTQYKMTGERRFYDEASRYYLMAKAIRDEWRNKK